MNIKVLYEDKHVIVCEKPANVPSQADQTGDPDMFSLVKDYLFENKIHNAKSYAGLHHRLDRPVGGVMLFTKSKEGNAKISKQIQTRSIKKEYLAVICGIPKESNIKLEHYLKKLGKINISKVVDSSSHGAKLAKLEFNVLGSISTENFGDLSLISIKLETGRHHQIRVQLTHAGFPLWGDTKYNKTTKRKEKWTQIALWAHSLKFTPPFKEEAITLYSYPKDIYPFSLFNYEK